MLSGKRVLLIVGGGIAACKTPELVRLIRKAGGHVRVILTKAGAEFVTPLTLASLTGEKVHDALFSLTDEIEMGHIELSRSADLVVVAPATADLMAKAAHGLANDLASTALLATDKAVLMAPAMNVRMWLNPATRRNLATLSADGISFIGPDEGEMACGEYGPGRMAEPAEILATIEAHFARELAPKPLAGKHVLITAGPTHEPIDPVRYIANRSSGKQGYALAEAAREAGARVTLVSGPVTLPEPQGVRTIRVETAREMDEAVEQALPADLAIFAAAVADWRVADELSEKRKKDGNAIPPLRLTENPDILARISRHAARRPRLVVGFAAETEKVLEHAQAKFARKGCDLLVANDVSPASGVMGGDRNRVHLVSPEGVESLPEMGKGEVATALIARFAEKLARRG
ncbi:MAG: bifunctional phosphopantothenoylcysteine decarboxylase/phosphopantothenate--cysteine ligase CoaBC [Methylobacterium sp.]|nr:bifunctional phosphopantothenoylcysteine decarboxylase/phosphopantothenate--cysteine ligase CoaBC [Methylobacterium sp.]MCA3609115.1 bifunctional phosphopantothenoylcysteine decarboxylase/phosphopantothenate--cysteine ligase CoaBC [Methylobacterium sp.]MCA3617547.1 bifunctional phosphopantothenoylcysteine decarboxylase/phosphopantothenate--cysteine ligase CoaBC [Methylobacterium sp.]MCA3620016.1 bifunctional phosphopantothenoylcysteine decarboxylase/phosphopantothenate--cysteine ligase CoaBC 